MEILFDNPPQHSKLLRVDGVVAQLVEHHNGIVGVRGSNPLGSTILLFSVRVRVLSSSLGRNGNPKKAIRFLDYE